MPIHLRGLVLALAAAVQPSGSIPCPCYP